MSALAVDGGGVSTASDILAGRFMIPADEVKRHMQEGNMTIEEFLFSLIQPATYLARNTPISGFKVG
jgi:hypothetical protein